MAIRVAYAHDIPVYNLFNERDVDIVNRIMLL